MPSSGTNMPACPGCASPGKSGTSADLGRPTGIEGTSMSQSEPGTTGPIPSTALSDADLLVHSLSYDLDRPVMTLADSGRVVTAGEFRDVISCYAQALKSKGLKKGARVGLI